MGFFFTINFYSFILSKLSFCPSMEHSSWEKPLHPFSYWFLASHFPESVWAETILRYPDVCLPHVDGLQMLVNNQWMCVHSWVIVTFTGAALHNKHLVGVSSYVRVELVTFFTAGLELITVQCLFHLLIKCLFFNSNLQMTPWGFHLQYRAHFSVSFTALHIFNSKPVVF